MTTVLICASSGLEAELSRTLFWREDLERYVAERTDDARMLILSAEPHILVVERQMPGGEELMATLGDHSLPHALSVIALSRDVAVPGDGDGASGMVHTVLPLPPGPEWDVRLVEVLQMPARQQERFDIQLGMEARHRHKAATHRGLAVNISAGGVLLDCRDAELGVGEDVHLTLQIPGAEDPVEGRGRIVRQPIEELLAVRFEAFSGNGFDRVRDFLTTLTPPRNS
jgi:hypothetical protein